MKKNVLIIGSGGVGHVVAHKCAQYNDELGDIWIVSRNKNKCDNIVNSIMQKNSIRDYNGSIYIASVDATDIDNLCKLIDHNKISIVINVGTAFINMNVLTACIKCGVDYIDTAIYEDPNKVCEDPVWYENYEWKRKEECQGINVILGCGFDPGVVNAYYRYTKDHYIDEIDSIDIIDVNAGKHNRYFATNFDVEINFREFVKVWTYINNTWLCYNIHSVKRTIELPEIGKHNIYLNGHDEIHSLSVNSNAKHIRFWMSFSDHYINVFSVLKNIGLTSHNTIKVDDVNVVPLRVLKALLPDPMSLAQEYTGKTWIGDIIIGKKQNKQTGIMIYNICNHEEAYNEVESQAISYTAGVPTVAAAIMLSRNLWSPKCMVNVEELPADDFLSLLNEMGLRTEIIELNDQQISTFKELFTVKEPYMYKRS